MAGLGKYRDTNERAFNELDKDGFDAYMAERYAFVRQKMTEREEYMCNKQTPSGPYVNISSFEMGGKKDLDNKLRLDLVPLELEEEVAKVLGFGAKHYGDGNWEKGIPLDHLLAASKRHILKFKKGEILDTESGLHHLSHAVTNLMMALVLELRGKI